MLGLITIKVYPIAKSNWSNEEKLEVKEQDLSIKEKNTGTNRFNVSHRSPYVDVKIKAKRDAGNLNDFYGSGVWSPDSI
ncbi:hypothetical protein A499_03418 [Niallia nealsonii AAU1]|nr:hypothetical protein A499_03418 [Niallia nealsonii AAU1]